MKGIIAFLPPSTPQHYVSTLPPLGILGIASFLELKGYDIDIFDGNVQKNDIDYDKYDFYCFSINVSNIENTYRTISVIKTKYPNKKVILGGPITLDIAKNHLEQSEADVVLIGEAEQSMFEYLQGKKPESIKGLCFKQKNGKIVYSGQRKQMFGLDSLPFPALDKVPIERYDVPIKKKRPISSIVTSRGCPQKCVFCFHDIVWRPRSPEHVVDEIEWQAKKLGVKEIAISDDNFTHDMSRVEEICDLIIKRKIKLRLQAFNGVRADRLNYNLLRKMKNAGFWLIAIAPETGSKKIQKKIKKNIELEQFFKVVNWCKKLSLNTFAFYMIGFPWETKKDIEQTIKFACRLDTDFAQFSRLIPMIGTELYNQIKSVDRNYNFNAEKAYFYGTAYHNAFSNISNSDIKILIKKAYRSFYLNPKKMLRILRILSVWDIYKLAKFSIITKSI